MFRGRHNPMLRGRHNGGFNDDRGFPLFLPPNFIVGNNNFIHIDDLNNQEKNENEEEEKGRRRTTTEMVNITAPSLFMTSTRNMSFGPSKSYRTVETSTHTMHDDLRTADYLQQDKLEALKRLTINPLKNKWSLKISHLERTQSVIHQVLVFVNQLYDQLKHFKLVKDFAIFYNGKLGEINVAIETTEAVCTLQFGEHVNCLTDPLFLNGSGTSCKEINFAPSMHDVAEIEENFQRIMDSYRDLPTRGYLTIPVNKAVEKFPFFPFLAIRKTRLQKLEEIEAYSEDEARIMFCTKKVHYNDPSQIASVHWANVGKWLGRWRWEYNIGSTLGQC